MLLWDLKKGSSSPTRHRASPHCLFGELDTLDLGPEDPSFKSHHSGHDLGPGSGLRLVSPCTLCTCWVLGTREADSYLLTQVREARRAQSPGSRVSPRGGLYVRHSPEPDQGGARDQRSPRPLSVQHLPGDTTRAPSARGSPGPRKVLFRMQSPGWPAITVEDAELWETCPQSLCLPFAW